MLTRYVVVIAASLITFSTHGIAGMDLPFIGKRSFNFYGGTGTEESIEIKKDGTTIIKSYSDPTLNYPPSIKYRGKFKNPILKKDRSGWLLKGNKIYQLSKEKIAHGCDADETAPCASDLYQR